MVTRYNHVDRCGDMPSGIQTLNRLRQSTSDLAKSWGVKHILATGVHFAPEVPKAGGYVQFVNGRIVLHESWGPIQGIQLHETATVAIVLQPGTVESRFYQTKITVYDGFAIPTVHQDMLGTYSVSTVRLWADASTQVDRDFAFAIWGAGQADDPPQLAHIAKAKGDYWGAGSSNAIAKQLQSLYDGIAAEHDPTTGAHDHIAIPVGGGYVSESAGAYTLEEKYGLVLSIAEPVANTIRVTLSGSGMKATDGSDFRFGVHVTPSSKPTPSYVTFIDATKFDITLRNTDNSGTDAGAFTFHIFGIPA